MCLFTWTQFILIYDIIAAQSLVFLIQQYLQHVSTQTEHKNSMPFTNDARCKSELSTSVSHEP